jgi:hypothetical protein
MAAIIAAIARTLGTLRLLCTTQAQKLLALSPGECDQNKCIFSSTKLSRAYVGCCCFLAGASH